MTHYQPDTDWMPLTLAQLDFGLNSPNAPLGMIVGHEATGTAASALIGYLRDQAAPGPEPE